MGKWLLTFILTFQCSLQAAGNDDSFAEGVYQFWLKPLGEKLAAFPNEEHPEVCTESYQQIYQKGFFDIRLGLGYMDLSTGESFVSSETGENFGPSVAFDYWGRQGVEKALLKPCTGNLQTCGFQKVSETLFTKHVTAPNGNLIEVRLQLVNGAYSPRYADNLGSLHAEQEAHSTLAESVFFSGVSQSDAVIYLGHARNGGGPDFRPPVLRTDGHPDYYGYYLKHRPGLAMLKSAFAQPGLKPILLALIGCFTEYKFGKWLKLNNTTELKNKMGYILTNSSDKMSFQELTVSGYATVDALLRFQCASNFKSLVDLSVIRYPQILIHNFLGFPDIEPKNIVTPNKSAD